MSQLKRFIILAVVMTVGLFLAACVPQAPSAAPTTEPGSDGPVATSPYVWKMDMVVNSTCAVLTAPNGEVQKVMTVQVSDPKVPGYVWWELQGDPQLGPSRGLSHTDDVYDRLSGSSLKLEIVYDKYTKKPTGIHITSDVIWKVVNCPTSALKLRPWPGAASFLIIDPSATLRISLTLKIVRPATYIISNS